MRNALVAALADCAGSLPSRWRTRRFLTGLSSDELQFIAAHLGLRILNPLFRPRPWTAPPPRTVPDGCAGSPATDRCSHDWEHKVILLLEFLGRSGMRYTPPRVPAARWN